jgi:hypothetical protein
MVKIRHEMGDSMVTGRNIPQKEIPAGKAALFVGIAIHPQLKR